jgi:7-cyano-7-deazaguanine synthase
MALAYWLRPKISYTIDYGQKPAEAEIRSSRAICKALKIRHDVIRVDCSSLGSGDLAGKRALNAAATSEWWPYRNQLLITLAASRAVGEGVTEIALGCLATDRSHVDGRAEFIRRMDRLLSLQEGHIRIIAPAIRLTAAGLVKKSGIPMKLLAWAHSCHRSNLACGNCRGCFKHRDVYRTLGQVVY